MKRFLSWTLSAAVLLAAASVTRADEEFKPVAAVVVTGLENVGNKIGALCQLANAPVPRWFEAHKTDGLSSGADLNAPSGVFVVGDKEGQATPCAFFPISNVEGYVAYIKKARIPSPSSSTKESTRAGQRRASISSSSRKANGFIGQVAARCWPCAGRSVEVARRSSQSLRRGGEAVSQEHHQGLLPKIARSRTAANQGETGRDAGGSAGRNGEILRDEQTGTRGAELLLPALVAKINEAESAIAGVSADPGAGRVRLDVEIVASNGTPLADRFALVKPGPTSFAGFLLPEAALGANWTRSLGDDEVLQAKGLLADCARQTGARIGGRGPRRRPGDARQALGRRPDQRR